MDVEVVVTLLLMIKLPHRSKTHVAENKSCPAGANRTSLMLEAATAAVQMLLLRTKKKLLVADAEVACR